MDFDAANSLKPPATPSDEPETIRQPPITEPGIEQPTAKRSDDTAGAAGAPCAEEDAAAEAQNPGAAGAEIAAPTAAGPGVAQHRSLADHAHD